jgi:hypothetical protein
MNNRETTHNFEEKLSPEAAELFQHFRSSPLLSNKHSSYFYSYGHILSRFKGQRFTFVEIGVFRGGSLFMWRNYFGPNARIIGIDFNPEALSLQDHGFEIHIGNQSNADFWSNFFAEVGRVDVVLDDGGHTYEQQIKTVHYCLEHVNDNGVIIVEDTHTSYMRDYGYPSRYSFTEWTKAVLDGVNSRSATLSQPKGVAYQAVYSIQIFDSIVAFYVDRNRTAKSFPISNNQAGGAPEDFRFKDFEVSWLIPPQLQRFRFFKKLANSIAKRLSRIRLSRLRSFFESGPPR